MPARYRRGDEVRIQQGACLERRSPAVQCGNCSRNCPTGAIIVRDGRPDISLRCVGCGRCAAVCPTDALQFNPIVSVSPAPVQDGSYAIACHRIASGVGADVVVHCLGSLSPSAWLSLVGEAWPRAVEICDAGACATCAAGGVAAPWTEPLGRATRKMACAGLSFARAPRVVPVTADEDDEAPDPARRRLLGLFALDSTKVTVIDPPTKRPSAKTDATEIGRQAAALLELVAAGEPESNVTAMPAAVVTPACNVCGACAAICPTPALTISECGDGERRLSFEGRQCVHCLACQSVCPTGALAVCESGGTGERTVVQSLALTACAACGDDFVADAGQSLCQVCQRAAELGADAALRSWSPGGARGLLSAFSTRE